MSIPFITITPSSSAQTYTIPAGYHNGSGKVTVSAASASVGASLIKLQNSTSDTISYTHKATNAIEYILIVGHQNLTLTSNNGTVLYETDTGSFASNWKSYNMTKIVKLTNGQSVTASAKYIIEFVRLA